MKIIKKIQKKIYNLLLFRRKSINSDYENNFNYFEKNELLLDEYINCQGMIFHNFNDENEKLSNLLYNFFRSNNFTLKDFSKIVSSKIIYNKTGITPDDLQQLLVEHYSRSNGLFQDVLHNLLNVEPINKLSKSSISSDIFGIVSSEEINTFVLKIKNDGYIILPKLVSIEKINRIKNWSYDIKYNVVDYFEKRYLVDKVDFQNPNVITANALEEDLEINEDITSLIFDPVIIEIISKYLGIEKPALIHLCMWWTFKSNNIMGSSEAAQLYHYDLDHIKWLKVFIYLTDVGNEDGPHVYIPKSHKSGNKNYKLLERGYSRVNDNEMSQFQKIEPKKVLGPAGSIIIGDTKCFHKGSPVISNPRLVLQPTFGPNNLLKINKK